METEKGNLLDLKKRHFSNRTSKKKTRSSKRKARESAEQKRWATNVYRANWGHGSRRAGNTLSLRNNFQKEVSRGYRRGRGIPG